MSDSSQWRQATRLIHGGTQRSQFGETSESLFLTQGFVYDQPEEAEARFKGEREGFVYSRYGNPTVSMFEERLALFEGAEAARATSSGMAAVSTALLALLKAGDHVVAAKALFGGCRYIIDTFLPRFGVDFTLVDGANLDEWQAAIKPNTRLFFFETPCNPLLELVDIEGVAALAKTVGAYVVIDNVFATPCYQSPLQKGCDLVVYSATKHIDGQGRCLAGAILGSRELVEKTIHPLFRQLGPTLSPFNAWVMIKGLETLTLRVNKMTDNAEMIADFLAEQKGIKAIFYPHHKSHPQYKLAKRQMERGSTMVAFELADKEGAFRFLNALDLIKISNNLGDAKSLITHPSTTTHQRFTEEERREVGIHDGLLRLSVGLEDARDLIDDISQALEPVAF